MVKTKAPVRDVELSDVQLAVMRALWAEGPATTATVYERVGKPRSLAYTTVATLLTRLEKRRLAKSHKQGRERVFEALISEDRVTRSMVSGLIAKLFRGDPRALVSHLIQDAEIGDADLEELRRALAEAPTHDD